MKYLIGINDKDLKSFYMDWDAIGSHLLVGGPFQSGRTSLLKTIVLSMAYQYSPEEVNIVLFDASQKSLSDLTDLPHVVDWVAGEDKFAQNIAHLRNELDFRRQNEGQDIKEKYPEIVFVFDDYDLARDAMGINEEILLSLGKSLRQDSDLGFHFVIALLSGSRMYSDSLVNQLKLLRVGISLGNTDTLETLGFQVTSSMRGTALPQGRGYLFERSHMNLLQFANPNNPSLEKTKQAIKTKWDRQSIAYWKHPATIEQIQQVKAASEPDVRVIQEKNAASMTKSFIDMDASVLIYREQQQRLRGENQ